MKRNDLFVRTFYFTIALTLIASVITYLVVGMYEALSLLLGSTTMLWGMSLLSKQSKIIVQLDERSAKRQTIFNYFIRLVVYGIVLAYSQLNPNLNIFYTLPGLLIFKVVLYIQVMIARYRNV